MKWFLKVLKQYADFSGRARRKEYWMFTLISIIISYSISIIGMVVIGEYMVTSILSMIYSFGILIPSLAVGVRRMHDAGKSGWYLLIPIYNLILACTDSEEGANKWGENPKGIGNDSVIDSIGTE